MIKIRKYRNSDALITWQLFYNTVREVNIQDYSFDQVCAWAPERFDEQKWACSMKSINPLIAELDGIVVGYADLQPDGLIDHFFAIINTKGLVSARS